jgi:hypothetical protein
VVFVIQVNLTVLEAGGSIRSLVHPEGRIEVRRARKRRNP